MPKQETNDSPDLSPRPYLWSVEKDEQLGALRTSIRISADDLVEYLQLRAERARIEWHFCRLERAFRERIFQAVSNRLTPDDSEVVTAERFKQGADLEAAMAEQVSDRRQSLLAAARSYYKKPVAQRRVTEPEFRALVAAIVELEDGGISGSKAYERFERETGISLSEFASLDPSKEAPLDLMERRVAGMNFGITPPVSPPTWTEDDADSLAKWGI